MPRLLGREKAICDFRFPGLAVTMSSSIARHFARVLRAWRAESATARDPFSRETCGNRGERVAVSRMECDGKFDDAFKTGPRIERASFPARRPRKRVTRALGGSARARSAGYQIESSRLSYFPREFSAWRPPAESSEISKRRSRSSSAISSGKFDTLARSSELAVDD